MTRPESHEFPLSRLGCQFASAGSLKLQSREIVLAENRFRQFWMPKPGLFGSRNRRSRNHEVVLDFHRLLCIERCSDRATLSVETHLFASLLPKVRTNGAQNIFPDASVAPPRGCHRDNGYTSEELEARLQESEHERVSVAEFCQQSEKAVEFPRYSRATRNHYHELKSELFAGVTSLWWDDAVAAKTLIDRRWSKWCKGFGRRRGNQAKKEALDILSYESKVAFLQCYSALWTKLIPLLIVDDPNIIISQRFHCLWHLVQRMPVKGRADIHLLHGLALGLHPAFGQLLTTVTGKRLIGEMIAAPEDIAAKERFLHAGIVSLYLYAAARQYRCTAAS